MKQLTKFMTRLRRRKPRRQDKHGSSMALVMIITSALVIWVMCLAPLMSTTGITALKVQNGYTDYLGSRSAIEYAKSELEFIVRSGAPYTFAVVEDGDGFKAVPKKLTGALNTEYSSYINYHVSDDNQDVPKNTATGNKVFAICAVTPPATGDNMYEIYIHTFIDGKRGMSFRVEFRETGSLLIYPEAYKQTDALPLNDFILVDGKMGANQVWVRKESGRYQTTVQEILQPWILNPDSDYASSGEYASILKYPAEAATATEDGFIGGDPLIDEPFTEETWIRPFGSYDENNNGATDKKGVVYLKKSSDRYQVWLNTGSGNGVDITGKCKLYVNGTEVSRSYQSGYWGSQSYYYSLPTDGSAFRVTVDYEGTGTTYNTANNAVNALGAKGLVVMEYDGKTSSFQNSAPTLSPSLSVEKTSATTMKVTVSNIGEGGLYYSNYDEQWRTDRVYPNLDNSKVYYFYAYMPAKVDSSGEITPASAVTYAGAVAGFGSAVSKEKLDNSKQYWIMNGIKQKNSSKINLDVAMKNDNGLGAQKFIAEGTTANGGYVLFDTNTNSDNYKVKWDTFKWMADKDKGYIYQGSEYLNLSATLSTPQNPTKEADFSWSYSVSLNGKNAVTLSESNNGLSIYESFSETRTLYKWQSGGCSGGSYVENGPTTLETKSYLNISGSNNNSSTGSVSASADSSTVYFVEVQWTGLNKQPSAPSAPASKTQVNGYTTGSSWSKLYANGKEVTGSLNPGIYIMTGYSDTQILMPCVHRVEKSNLTSSLSVNFTQDENDDCKVTFTGTSSSGDNGGVRYIGFKLVGEENYKWFPTTANGNEHSVTVRIPYGQYVVVFRESGNRSYNGREVFYHNDETGEDVANITAEYLEFEEDDFATVKYTFEDGKVVWYKPLPEGVTLQRLNLVYGTPGADNSISWSETPSDESRYFGVYVDYSNYDSIDKVLRLPQPLGVTNENGHTSSMIRGSAVYFMGEANSINTYNNSMYVTTDLLVLNSSITGGDQSDFKGYVYVYPYTEAPFSDGTPRDTLLFATNNITNLGGETVFKENYFYRIPSGTDIYDLSATTAAGYEYGHVDHEDPKAMESVNWAFREGYYPEISLDIAFATREQLEHIVSSERMGWTQNGVLKGSNSSYNEGYAVCVYVTDTSGAVTYSANRILIAVPQSAGRTLNVPADMTFTTRYLSINAEVIQQGGSSKLTINNLGQDAGFIGQILNELWSYSTYSSKTLQVDYERNTRILLSNGQDACDPKKPQICRYDNGANLFVSSEQALMTPYTIKEIEDLRDGISGGIFWDQSSDKSTVKMVDRYVYLFAEEGGDGKLELHANDRMNLQIYANYVQIAPSVTHISVTCDNDPWDLVNDEGSYVMICSQEYGYSSTEYLGFFTVHSQESYSGTLLRLEGDLTVTYNRDGRYEEVTKVIPKGFYYISAKDSDGVTLREIAENPTAYEVDPTTLPDYAVNMKPNGSNAYVDTGLWGSGSGGASGFSGGSVQ